MKHPLPENHDKSPMEEVFMWILGLLKLLYFPMERSKRRVVQESALVARTLPDPTKATASKINFPKSGSLVGRKAFSALLKTTMTPSKASKRLSQLGKYFS